MRCRECGHEASVEYAFCGNCGARTAAPKPRRRAPSVPSPGGTAGAAAPLHPTEATLARRRGLVLPLLLIVALVATASAIRGRQAATAPPSGPAEQVLAPAAAPTPASPSDRATARVEPAAVPVVSHEIWRHVGLRPPVAPPVLAEGRVYAAASGGHVLALDLETGEEVWSSNARAADLLPVGIAVAGDRIVTTWESGLVAAFHASDGAFAWNRTLAGPLEAPTIVADTVVVLALSGFGGGPAVHAFDVADGAAQAVSTLAAAPTGAAIGVGRSVLLCDRSGSLTLLELPQLTRIWTTSVSEIGGCAYDPASGRAIWAGRDGGGAIDATTGAAGDVVVPAPPGGDVSVRVTADGFLVASDRAIVAFDASGDELWRRGLADDALVDPITAAGSGFGVIASDPTGFYLHELSPLGGRLTGRSTTLSAPMVHAPIALGDRVVLVLADGSVTAHELAP